MIQQAQERLPRINELAAQAADELGLILLGVRMGQQGKNKNLEISIYRKEPAISFSDCEKMSRTLEALIENEENQGRPIVNSSYLLEVVSAGIDRQLTTAFEFNLFAGSKVRITAKEKIGSLGTEFTGVLLGGDEQSISLANAMSLLSKGSGKQGRTGKKEAEASVEQEKISVNLQQIYRIFLYPEIKETSKSAE